MAGLSRPSVARPMLVEMAGSGPAMTMGGSAVAPFGALIPQRTLILLRHSFCTTAF